SPNWPIGKCGKIRVQYLNCCHCVISTIKRLVSLVNYLPFYTYFSVFVLINQLLGKQPSKVFNVIPSILIAREMTIPRPFLLDSDSRHYCSLARIYANIETHRAYSVVSHRFPNQRNSLPAAPFNCENSPIFPLLSESVD